MPSTVKDWSSWVHHNVAAPSVTLRLGKWARWAGRRVAQGELYGVRQDEEALTSSLLLDLLRDLPDLRVRTLSHHEEATDGADWEWWIQGATRWFGALIQAKRLSPDGTYGFNYTTKPSKRNPKPQRQIDSLIETARWLNIPPLFVLYNDTGNPRRQLSSPRCRQQKLLPAAASGVTVLDAFTARCMRP
ncbi:DUF6615 family protein [Nocardia amamiensis]|uniref:DUF6615 family protein n=1 Tax=Nocardia amamiensis TaxID=404578 RepID=UPI0033C26C55